MKKVVVQGNFLVDTFCERQFKWIPEEVIEHHRVPFYKEQLDLYSYCTLNVTCKSIVYSGDEFSYDKLKKSINGMFRVLRLGIQEDDQKEAEINKMETEIESIIFLINFLLPLLSSNKDP